MAERTLPPVEQGTTTTKPNESTIVDKNTFQIKGVDSGQIYGIGRSLGEALALQTQLVSGGTPTVSGRPDMYAVSPLPSEAINPIEGANGQPVTPKVATLADLEARKAGTLTSFNKATGGEVSPQLAAAEKYNQAVKDTVQSVVTQQREEVLNADQNFDTQLQLQRGALYAALLDETIADEDLKWLTPAQQRAINSGDKNLIRSQIGGLNSISNARKESAAEAEAQKARELANATTRFNTLSELGALNLLSPEDKASLETQLNMPSGTIDQYMSKQEETGSRYEFRSAGDGNIMEIETDPETGRVISTKVIGAGYQVGTSTAGYYSNTSYSYTGNTGVFDLDVIDTGGPAAGNRSDRNNNPFNIKASEFTSTFSGVIGIENRPAEDGGNFLVFDSVENGMEAGKRLWTTAAPYKGVTVAQGLMTWSNGGYGADVARNAGIDPNRDAQSLSSSELNSLFNAMGQAEGFTGGVVEGVDSTNTGGYPAGTLSKDAFTLQFAEQWSTLQGDYGMTLDPSQFQTEINAAYQEYLSSIGSATGGITLEDMQKLLTNTDKQKMFAQGLDYNNQEDISNYIQNKHAEEDQEEDQEGTLAPPF